MVHAQLDPRKCLAQEYIVQRKLQIYQSHGLASISFTKAFLHLSVQDSSEAWQKRNRTAEADNAVKHGVKFAASEGDLPIVWEISTTSSCV